MVFPMTLHDYSPWHAQLRFPVNYFSDNVLHVVRPMEHLTDFPVAHSMISQITPWFHCVSHSEFNKENILGYIMAHAVVHSMEYPTGSTRPRCSPRSSILFVPPFPAVYGFRWSITATE